MIGAVFLRRRRLTGAVSRVSDSLGRTRPILFILSWSRSSGRCIDSSMSASTWGRATGGSGSTE